MVDKLTDDQARLLGLAEHVGPSMSDQEVRARALECAVGTIKTFDSTNMRLFWEIVHTYEAYIRDGVT